MEDSDTESVAEVEIFDDNQITKIEEPPVVVKTEEIEEEIFKESAESPLQVTTARVQVHQNHHVPEPDNLEDYFASMEDNNDADADANDDSDDELNSTMAEKEDLQKKIRLLKYYWYSLGKFFDWKKKSNLGTKSWADLFLLRINCLLKS